VDDYSQKESANSSTVQPQKKIIKYIERPIRNTLLEPGVQFVTLFCDDNQVPLPKTMMDLVSSFAEKMVPDSFQRLYDTAKKLDQKLL
jgi:hypothetical protein